MRLLLWILFFLFACTWPPLFMYWLFRPLGKQQKSKLVLLPGGTSDIVVSQLPEDPLAGLHPMERQIFIDHYFNVFLPRLEQRQRLLSVLRQRCKP